MTIITDAPPRRVARADSSKFYVAMALTCAATAFIGFAPTYWWPLASRTLQASPIVHLHGALFFAWSLFFIYQSWLASSGRVMKHREVGLIGVSFATAMTIFGTMVAIHAMQRSAAIGMREEGIAFAIVPLSGIAFFAISFTLAVAMVRRPDVPQAADAAGGDFAARRRGGALVLDLPGARRRDRPAAGRSDHSAGAGRLAAAGACNGVRLEEKRPPASGLCRRRHGADRHQSC